MTNDNSPQRPASTAEPRYVVRVGRPTVQTTYQLQALVGGGPAEGPSLAQVAGKILDWIAEKFPHALPADAKTPASFDIDLDGQQRLSCEYVAERQIWAARLTQPDAPYKDRPAVAGRHWTTDISLVKKADDLLFTIRASCASVPFADAPVSLNRPRIVLDLAASFGLMDVQPIGGQPRALHDSADVETMFRFVFNKKRRLPVILLTERDSTDLAPRGPAPFVLDAAHFAARTEGYAHIFCLPNQLNAAWNERFGDDWSLFDGAIRVFVEGAELAVSSSLIHPLFSAAEIAGLQFGDEPGERGFESFLLERSRKWNAGRPLITEDCIYLLEAKALAQRLDRERKTEEIRKQIAEVQSQSLQEKLLAREEEFAKERDLWQNQLEEKDQEREHWESFAAHCQRETDSLRSETQRLRIQNDALRAAIEKKTGKGANDGLELPQTYAELDGWVRAHLLGRLIFHPRVAQALKKAEFEDLSLVCNCLLLLANEYRQSKLVGGAAYDQFEAGVAKLHLHFSKSLTKGRAAEYGDAYFVAYPVGSNFKRELNLHIRNNGNTHDPRRCFALYFFWDDETHQVVVGWLPSHLDTWQS